MKLGRSVVVISMIVLSLAFYAHPALCATVYVKFDSANDGPGNDWDHAFHSVQASLNAAVSGDEVWVAAGTYVQCITLKAGVGLYGGFMGTETARDQRNWNTNVTVLDGNQGGSVVTSPSGATSTTIIDGFTIRNGNGTTVSGSRRGGGIYCDHSSPTVRNNVLTGNRNANYGAGICCRYSSAIIDGNLIVGNLALSRGGGIDCYEGSPSITFNVIEGNSAANNGGGIGALLSSPYVSSNSITGNSTNSGGGLWLGQASSPIVEDNTISRNTAHGNGGAIYVYDWSSPTIRGNTMTDNSAEMGGGIFCYWECQPNIARNLIAHNSATWDGGAVFCDYNCSPEICDNLINDNRCGRRGGALYCEDSCLPTLGGNTVTLNSAEQGGAIYAQSGSSPTAKNTIFLANDAIQGGCAYKDGSSGVDFSHCRFQANGTQPFYPAEWYPPGTNDNSIGDPRFLAPWVKDYHLLPSSPCIDAGDDTAVQAGAMDLDGKQRILGTHVDMGCFEWDSTPYWVRQVGQARATPEGNAIQMKSKAVTAAFGGAFYVEESDRSSGMRILSPELVAKGDLVTMTGQPVLDDGERSLQASFVTVDLHDDALVPDPFFTLNRSLGGGDCHLASDRGQQRIKGASGLNNIGLYIDALGRVTFADAGSGYFYLDDGSALDDGSGHLGVKTLGIVPDPDPVGKYVKVAGISSCFKVGDDLHRLIRARDQADIVVMQ